MSAIAIDGPAGAGKSTVARLVAEALGWRYLDTGALYRALTLAALARGVPVDDGTAVAMVARGVDLQPVDDRILLDGLDVTERIRHDDVTAAVSTVAAHPEVREALVDLQRELALASDVVVEGRDIGTHVLPDAEVKIWLTAQLDERALRRARQEGDVDELDDVRTAIDQRDQADAQRDASPLKRAPDAVEIDTTDLGIDDVVQRIVDLATRR
jgi:cytidylate kinase